MLYLEHRPAAPLSQYVEAFWYAKADVELGTTYRERVLPAGRVQVVINLCGDRLTDCGPAPFHSQTIAQPPAIVAGARTGYSVIDSADLHELIGIMFRPHGFSAFGVPAGEVPPSDVALADVWGARASVLVNQLRDSPELPVRWQLLETFLRARLSVTPHAAVCLAVHATQYEPDVRSVYELASECGLSRRRFGQLVREQVGLTPKSFLRIQRFQRALQLARAGREIGWAAVAQDCGFFDQSHLVKEFHHFAGVTPEHYRAHQTRWTNHVRLGS